MSHAPPMNESNTVYLCSVCLPRALTSNEPLLRVEHGPEGPKISSPKLCIPCAASVISRLCLGTPATQAPALSQ
jgi:hypothetical protein